MSLTRRVLYSSSLVSISDVVCTEGCGNGRHEEYCPVNSLALVRRGTFVRRDRLGRHVADATRTFFFNKGDFYTTDHPFPGGDRCTVLVFPDAILREAMRPARGEPEKPFARAAFTGDPALQLAHRELLRVTQLGDAMGVEETALDILRACTHDGYMPRLRGEAANRAAALADDVRVLVAGLLSERVTLEMLAMKLEVSPFRLCRAFRDATGGTLHAYLTSLRLATALEKLPEYRERLTDLALGLGFNSHSHFTQTFHARFGQTPSAYLRTGMI